MKTALIILDGWGLGNPDGNNAIEVAKTPYVDRLSAEVPHATLRTDGEHVGLPSGQLGNSEVGHMHIGAGRVVYQDLLRIDRAVADGSFHQEAVLREALREARRVASGRGYRGVEARREPRAVLSRAPRHERGRRARSAEDGPSS